MNKNTMTNNVVSKEVLRPIQQSVLQALSDILKQSFGPMGSNTCLKKENAFNIYTKDGHTILKNIHFYGIIEQSIKDDIESITRHIVTTVGDGTTSAVMMSNLIFEAICKYSDSHNLPPVEVLKEFNITIDEIVEKIRASATECTVDDIYDITMIATNGNEFISKTMKDIYSEFGMQVFIDVLASTDENTSIKSYDGMTINTGFNNPCYVTNPDKNEAVIDNPSVYFFKDPIDTKEMAGLLDTIIDTNIYKPLAANNNPYGQAKKEIQIPVVPTVIVAPKISVDLSAMMKSITDYMSKQDPSNRLPLLIITDYHQNDIIGDIALLTGAKEIRKYIDPEIYKADVEAGRAATPNNVVNFAGTCESVVANSAKTSFINPANKKDKDGNYTKEYNNLLTYVKTQLNQAKADGEDARVIGGLKRRLHALESNLVELNIGGISQADRDSLRDLVEDAVLNCRSAAANGVGFGANFSGYLASDIRGDSIAYSIHNAYAALIEELYSTCNASKEILKQMETIKMPYNIRTGAFDGKVKSSIESDIIVLQTVSKIVGLMATCNQFVVPTAMHNVYVDYDD